MRKDNSNNADRAAWEVWMTISVGVEARTEGRRRGRQIDDGDGKSKRVDCTTNIDIANSSSPLPVVWLVEDDELSNESFKTSAKRKANSDFKCCRHLKSEESFNVTDECNVAKQLLYIYCYKGLMVFQVSSLSNKCTPD